LKYLRRTTIKIKSTYNVSQIESKYRFSNYCETHISVIPSKKGIKKAISKGELRLNGEISFVDLEKTPPKEYHLKLDIIFEDEHLAVIFKPAGISVSGNLFKTIQNALLYNIKISKEPDALDWPLPVHRLDNQTSGLLLIAKTKLARVKLGQAFESKTILKKYQAVIIGKTNNSGEINTDVDDKSSQSHYKLIDSVPSLKNEFLSLIELEPKTGRTHQLRIHCASINHPILGDKLYGDEGMILKNKGLFLCATTISFNHPYSLQDLTFSTPTPHKFLKRMDNEKRRFLDFNKTEER
jgi:23S rRNA pseudouridine1911/1915/1917 synthase